MAALKSQQKDAKEARVLQNQQAFDTSLYNLFNIQNDIRNRLHISNSVKAMELDSRRPALASCVENTEVTFEELFNALRRDYNFFSSKNGTCTPACFSEYMLWSDNYGWESFEEMLLKHYNIRIYNLDPEKSQAEIYKRFLGEFRNAIGHYYRHLYHILKFVFDHERDMVQRTPQLEKEIHKEYKKYVDMLQAQMSTHELALCFYNGLIFKRAKFLYQYYDFLENLNKEELLDKSDVAFYCHSIEVDGVQASGIDFKSKTDW